ncbi:MAG: hypothetical protein ABSA79_09055 [Candidatus Bathyarchaeia archaeon]
MKSLKEKNNFSPFILSALEDLQHARELSERGGPIDCKYAVISSASAVEYILKEKIRVLGAQVYTEKNSSIMLGFVDSVNFLKQKGVTIPLETETRMLQNLRNDCIHRSYKPDAKNAQWFVEIAKKFAEDFCKNELNVDIKEHEVIEAIVQPIALELLHSLNARKALQENRFVDAILSSGILLDLLMADYAVSKGLNKKYAKRQALLEFIRTKTKDLSSDQIKHITRIRVVRGELSKGKSLPTKEQSKFVVDAVISIYQSLSDLWTRESRCCICGKSDIALKREEGNAITKFYCEDHARDSDYRAT